MTLTQLKVSFRIFALPFITGLIGTASAGGRVSNGGNAVVCYESVAQKKIVSVQLFDYWEQAQVEGKPFASGFGAPDLSLAESMPPKVGNITDGQP